MSVEAISWAIKTNVNDWGCRLVLICLANRLDEHTSELTISNKLIMQDTRLSQAAIRRKIIQLKKDGCLRVVPRFNEDGAQEYNLIALNIDFSAINEDDDESEFLWTTNVKDKKPYRRPRKEKWRSLRNVVFDRNGFKCTYCGDEKDPFECDHIHPVAKGSSHDLSNLTTACKRCNASKRDRTIDEWVR